MMSQVVRQYCKNKSKSDFIIKVLDTNKISHGIQTL